MKHCITLKCFSILLILLLFSCGDNSSNNTELINEYENKISQLRDSIDLLQNTPEKRLYKAENLFKSDNAEDAIKELNTLIKLFPESDKISEAENKILAYQKKIDQDLKKAEKLKSEGFKVFKETTNFEHIGVSYKISNKKISDKWIFDRYENRYFLRNAERGEKFWSATANVTSTLKETNLLPFFLYKVDGDKLSYIRTVQYKFYRWQDYSYYLGTYPDKSNDFKYSETIKFTLGTTIQESEENEVLFIVSQKIHCVQRENVRYDNPPINYNSLKCPPLKQLTLERLDKDFIVVDIINKSKL